jgi:hypothetical protein
MTVIYAPLVSPFAICDVSIDSCSLRQLKSSTLQDNSYEGAQVLTITKKVRVCVLCMCVCVCVCVCVCACVFV